MIYLLIMLITSVIVLGAFLGGLYVGVKLHRQDSKQPVNVNNSEAKPIVEPTEEQISRLEEVIQLNISEGFGGELSAYVEFGIFPEGINHVLRPIQIQKESGNLSNYVLDVDMRLTMQELGL